MRFLISEQRSPSAGSVRACGKGDVITVHRSAIRRHDWAPLSVAVMTAYARGAHVTLVDDIEMEN